MAFSLAQVKKTRRDTPPRTLVYGPHKIGKSTFASCAPKPIFLITEDGQDAIDAEAFPLCKSWDDLLEQVGALYQEKHGYQTVVLDSGDWAERLLHKHICAKEDVNSIEKVGKGFGKGYVRAAELFTELLDGLNALRTERGMGVVILCHTKIKRLRIRMTDTSSRSTSRSLSSCRSGPTSLVSRTSRPSPRSRTRDSTRSAIAP
jgi:hypothetical protein